MGIIVVGGVLKRNGKYLLVQEAKNEFRGKWNPPAGRLNPGENVLEGAKREIFEESGFTVKLTGIVKIRNSAITNDSFIGIIFDTDITDSHENRNRGEILQTGWFTYDEILQMHDELRSYDWIVEAIDAVEHNKVYGIDLIGV